ncbi:MAG: cupin domain-containing protein [Flavobacteriaceae bacterium]|nr:cupin domain-containing protein [Flavobacteriaceae bacterium]
MNKLFTLMILIFALNLAIAQEPLPDPLEAGWKGNKVCEVIEEDQKLRILKCVFPPGVGHEKHYHRPHFGYAIAGSKFRITDSTGVREVDMKTGGYFSKDKIYRHEAVNIGDSTAIFLIIEPKQ